MGKCPHIYPQSHNLLLSLQHPPGILSVPWPLPSALLSPPGSHFPPAPLDGDGEDQADCEMWELAEGREWVDSSGGFALLHVNDAQARFRQGSAISCAGICESHTGSAGTIHHAAVERRDILDAPYRAGCA